MQAMHTTNLMPYETRLSGIKNKVGSISCYINNGNNKSCSKRCCLDGPMD
jgi:hypothetical protein